MNKQISPFKHLCMTIGNLPTAYVESMTYYECVTFLVKFIENQIMPAVNKNSEAITELQNLYIELKKYVDDYFDNLDIQEEINTKIDEMVESGEFQEIIFSNLCYVTYEMFGAQLDGVTDDTEAVINCHEYANEYGLKVIQNRGTLYMPTATNTNCPIVNTSCDFTGMTFKFDSNNDSNTVMIIADPDTLEDNNLDINSIDLTASQISYLGINNTGSISFLDDYKNHLICLATDMSFGKRYDDESTVYYKQAFLVNELSQLAPNNMYADISSNASNVKMRYLSIKQNPVDIAFGNIIIDGNTNNNPRFLVMRNNVTLRNAYVNKENYSSTTSWVQSLFDVRYSYNIQVENFRGNTPVNESSGTDVVSYIITFDQCYNVKLSDNKLLKGHGFMSSYYTSFIEFTNNYINRFDSHYGAYGNINIKDSNFVGYPCRVNIGYGNANVNIDSCNFYKYQENNKSWIDDIILCRSDIPVMFSGNINVNNCYINGKRATNNNEYVTLLQYITQALIDSSYPAWASYDTPLINIKNIKWNMTNLKFRAFRLYNNISQSYNLKNISVDLSEQGTQSKSEIRPDYISTGSAKINLTNTELKVLDLQDPLDSVYLNVNLFKNSVLDNALIGTNLTINANCYENCTINGVYATVENNGILTIQNGSTITSLFNYGKCESNGSTVTNLRSIGHLAGSSISTGNGYISGILRPTTFINTGNTFITGCFLDMTNLTNTDSTITMSGCSMYSSKASLFSGNGTVVGYGNYAGSNTNLVNSYTP